jgi:plasmid stabilization system protein ParE
MHAKAVVVLEEAAEDLAAGIAFYDAQEPGVGQYFIESLLADIASLELHAGTHAEHHGFYRMLASRFPFAVYYDVADDIARVAAVLDMRRDPTWLRQELEERSS